MLATANVAASTLDMVLIMRRAVDHPRVRLRSVSAGQLALFGGRASREALLTAPPLDLAPISMRFRFVPPPQLCLYCSRPYDN